MASPRARIRVAGPADAPELARLRWDFASEHREPQEPMETFLAHMAGTVRRFLSGPWTIWVAEDPATARLVGCAYLQRVEKVPRPYPRPAALGYVTNVYVVPQWRNRGIGSRMLDALLARAREEDLDLLMLWPSPRAASMYRRAGFRTSPDGLEHPLGHG